MAHVRQIVRDGFVARLSAMPGITTVCTARPTPFNQSELPALQIVTPSEEIEPFDNTDVETRRRIDVDVIVYALGDEGIDDTLDDFAAQVETLVLTATGAPWDSLIMHFPTAAEMTDGDLAEKTLYALRTRFMVDLQASTPETIG